MGADRSQVVEPAVKDLPKHLQQVALPLAWFEYVQSLRRQLEQVEAERDRLRDAIFQHTAYCTDQPDDLRDAALHPKERDDGCEHNPGCEHRCAESVGEREAE